MIKVHFCANQRALQSFLASGVIQPLEKCRCRSSHHVPDILRSTRKTKPISLNDQLVLFVQMMQNLSVATIVVEAQDACKDIKEFLHQGLEHIDNVKCVTVCTLCTGRNNCSLGKSIRALVPCRVALEQNITRDIKAYVAVQAEYRFKARRLQVRSAGLKDQVSEHELSHPSWGCKWLGRPTPCLSPSPYNG